jgi:regulator of protease activity HflC (stomatin/prohibitin superfamily)
MKEQMKAERDRRAKFIEAEGNKTATRLESEGAKLTKTNLGVADQEATRKM